MGIESPYIGLYGVWSVGGVGGEGYGLRLGVIGVWAGLVSGVIGVGGWRFRVFRIRTATLFCTRILRDSTPKNRVR